jgi:DNA-directed RNA polymerase subunit H (RpoH/RPB5)
MEYKDIRRAYRARKTVLEMLRDRGYDISPDIDVDAELFNALYEDRRSLNFFIEHPIPTRPRLYVHFYYEAKNFGKNELQGIRDYAFDTYGPTNLSVMILAKDERLNPTVKKTMELPEYVSIEVFLERQMIFNIMRHDLQPRIQILSDDEKKAVLERYETSAARFPVIRHDDPVARYYALQPGQMISETQLCPTQGVATSYRIVH